MAVYAGPEIVTNGLVLALDAGNTQSYPGSGTTWTDLSGLGNNGTLTNGPTFSSADKGSIVFDGVNDHVLIAGSTPTQLQGNPSFSVEGWFKRNSSWTAGSTWGIGGDVSSLQGINSWNYNNTNEIAIDLWGRTTYTTGQTYSSTAWQHIVWTYNGTSFATSNIIIYINQIAYTGSGLTSLRGSPGTPAINANGIVIGRAGPQTANYYSAPLIANFRIYSRVLTPAEVAQNFNALRGRFGI